MAEEPKDTVTIKQEFRDHEPGQLANEFSKQLAAEKEFVEGQKETIVATHEEVIEMRRAQNATTTPDGRVRRLEAKTVKAVWGQETFTPARFHTCTVGPFELEATVREGENALEVLHKLMRELERMAEVERERKIKSFIPNCSDRKD